MTRNDLRQIRSAGELRPIVAVGSIGSVVFEHPIGVLCFLQFFKGSVRLLKGVTTHDLQVLLEKSVVLVGIPFALGPLDLKPEDPGTFGEDVSMEVGKRDVLGGLDHIFVILITDVVAATEEFLFFVGH